MFVFFFFWFHSTEVPYDGSAMVRNERKLSSQMHNIMRERREASLAIDNMLSMVQNEGKFLQTQFLFIFFFSLPLTQSIIHIHTCFSVLYYIQFVCFINFYSKFVYVCVYFYRSGQEVC